MKKSNFLFVTIILFFISCSRQEYQTGSRGNADVSLIRNSSEYNTKRLREVTATGNSFWGIPSVIHSNGIKGKGVIVRVNGLALGSFSHGPLFPVLSLLGYTAGMGMLASKVGNYGAGNIDFPLACAVSLPIAGVLNNLTWRGTQLNGMQKAIDNSLLTENPGVDFFFNPRYTVEYQNGIWHSSTKVTAKVIGATLK